MAVAPPTVLALKACSERLDDRVNIRAGRVPPAEASGVRYLTIAMKLKGGTEVRVLMTSA
jgi:hypothetical protein